MLRKALVILVISAAVVSAIEDVEYHFLFNKFTTDYNKEYSTLEEFKARFAIFRENYDMITKHNEGDFKWTMGLNEYADLTWDEFKAGRLSPEPEWRAEKKNVVKDLHKYVNVKESVDWRDEGVVTGVKNQGQCGSCWSFSTTGSVEGAVALKTGNLVSLSEQMLVDCSRDYGNYGCNGGLMDYAFAYIKDSGICTEEAYPYQARDSSCKASSCTVSTTLSSWVDVESGSELDLEAAVSLGPVSVAIEADQPAFQFYNGGVMSGKCGHRLDHGVLAVGYGYDEDAQEDYWIVKNSWGTSWGDEGYIRLLKDTSRGSKDECGIAMSASYPIV